jgi:hypothetical protein
MKIHGLLVIAQETRIIGVEAFGKIGVLQLT